MTIINQNPSFLPNKYPTKKKPPIKWWPGKYCIYRFDIS